MPKTPQEDTLTFEQAMERIQSTIEAMENDSLPLEKMIEKYEEGIKLIRFCESKLTMAEKKIHIITQKAQGQTDESHFLPPSIPNSGDTTPSLQS